MIFGATPRTALPALQTHDLQILELGKIREGLNVFRSSQFHAGYTKGLRFPCFFYSNATMMKYWTPFYISLTQAVTDRFFFMCNELIALRNFLLQMFCIFQWNGITEYPNDLCELGDTKDPSEQDIILNPLQWSMELQRSLFHTDQYNSQPIPSAHITPLRNLRQH